MALFQHIDGLRVVQVFEKVFGINIIKRVVWKGERLSGVQIQGSCLANRDGNIRIKPTGQQIHSGPNLQFGNFVMVEILPDDPVSPGI
jgi:hypothetical protein